MVHMAKEQMMKKVMHVQEMMRAQQHAINNYGSQSVTRRGFNKPWVELVMRWTLLGTDVLV